MRSVVAPSPGGLPGRGGPTTQGVQRLVFWGALAVALVPFVVSAVTVFVDGRGYHSFEDNALTELNVRDVGHHAVELGVFNRFGWHHLGPAVFYLLAPVYRALGSRSLGLLIGALILNAAAVVGIALVARRRAGIGFALAALAGTTIVSHSLGPSFLRSPWTPNLVVLPFVLLVLLSWSLAEGDTLALPWAALVASFIVQAHLAPTPPTVATLVAGLAFGARRLTSNGLRGPPATSPGIRRHALVTAGVLAVIWLPPFVDVVTHAGGNVHSVAHYFLTTRSNGTIADGYRAVASQLTIPPPWLGRNPLPNNPFNLYALIVRRGAIPWVGIALVLTLVAAWRAGQRRALRFGVLVAVALVAETVGISRHVGPLVYWDVTYVPVTAMLAALAAAYGAWTVLATRRSLTWARPAAGALLIGALVVPASMLAATSTDPTRVQDYVGSRGISIVAQDTLRSLHGHKGPVYVRVLDSFAYGDLAAMVVLLDQHGFHAVVSEYWRHFFPHSSIHTTSRFDAVVSVLSPADALRYQAVPGERRVAGDPLDAPRTVSAFLARKRLPPYRPVVFLAPGSTAGTLRPAGSP